MGWGLHGVARSSSLGRGETGRIYFLTSNLDRASAKLHSLFGERLHEVFDYSYIHSCDDDPAAANAMAGGDSANWEPRYRRVYFVPIVRSKMATNVAGRRSKKTYVSLEAFGPGTFKVKDGLKACKFRWDDEEKAWHYDRDTDDRARKSFRQTARDLRAQFGIRCDGIPVRLKPASDEADKMHERMRETPVQEAEVKEERVQEAEVKEEVIEFGVKEEVVEETPVERGAGTNNQTRLLLESVIRRVHQILKTADLEKTTVRIIRKKLERDLGVDLSKREPFIRKVVEKFLKSNHDKKKMAPPPNRKRAAPAASHAGTMMSEARSRPRVKRGADAEATSVKREQSPEPSIATAQFVAGAPNTPGQATRVRQSPSSA